MQLLRFLCRWSWRVILALVLFFNLRLYAPSPLAERTDRLPPTLVAQLNANRAAIDGGTAEQMQSFFPEGFYFCHGLHGLTWVEAALRDPGLKPKAIAEAKQAMVALDSAKGKAPFPPELPPDHGMFYSAWKADLQAGIVLLSDGKDDGGLESLRDQCDGIADAFRDAPSPFLASYRGGIWPCDALPGIHAMAVYDRITNEGRYTTVVKSWLTAAKERLDPATGLLPHIVSDSEGRNGSVARATSQVIILRFLADIDPAFAREQYTLFRENFVTSFFGIPCVLEYPRGTNGRGDVDSGPLIFGRSISGTVLMIATAQIYGDFDLANAIGGAGEVVGLPWTSSGADGESQKRYVAGVLPVGDIIVGYSHVARPWFEGEEHPPTDRFSVSPFWRWKVHLVSLCSLIPTIIDQAKKRKALSAESNVELDTLSER